eukprot:TRINITY_DN1709_c0_g1_i1.p1 TRINITY_DN1709_c0_g1~~TRINITY_DN1709_c0_g1_i1.p1  ORF type:complete len:188 (-),score=6.91 TRINITY_DN1709_c0_g1_i1:276-839(-)
MAATKTTSPPLPLECNSYKTSSRLTTTFKDAHFGLAFLMISRIRVVRSREPSIAMKARYVAVEEEVNQIRRLQNGSDVRGVALEGEKGRKVDLTPQVVQAIAESFGEWVVESLDGAREDRVRVSLGRDPRVSGPSLSTAVFAGLALAGCEVFDMDLATTPACFMSTLLPPFAYDASIMELTRVDSPY